MDSANINIPIIFQLTDSSVYLVQNGNRNILHVGPLSILSLEKT
jgi:hypothetical protein